MKVDENKNVLGTETKEEASHFYMKCSENKTRSADFHIMFNDNTFSQPVPYYLSTKCNIFGCCKGPLSVAKHLEQAQLFCIHSDDRCLCACITLENWNSLIEAPMSIFCSHHSCIINGYIAIKKMDRSTYYNTSVVVGRRNSEEYGVLFQLEYIDRSSDAPNVQSPPSDAPNVQLISVNQSSTLTNVVGSTGSGMSDQQPCLSEHVN